MPEPEGRFGSIYDLTIREALEMIESRLDLRPDVIIEGTRLIFQRIGHFWIPSRETWEIEFRVPAPLYFAFRNVRSRVTFTPANMGKMTSAPRPILRVWRGKKKKLARFCDVEIFPASYKQKADFERTLAYHVSRREMEFNDGKSYDLEVDYRGAIGKCRTSIYESDTQLLISDHVRDMRQQSIPLAMRDMYISCGGSTRTVGKKTFHCPLKDWILEDLEVEFYGGEFLKR